MSLIQWHLHPDPAGPLTRLRMAGSCYSAHALAQRGAYWCSVTNAEELPMQDEQ